MNTLDRFPARTSCALVAFQASPSSSIEVYVPNKKTIQVGAFDVEFFEDSKVPGMYHYVICRRGNPEILMVGNEECFDDAERCAKEWVTDFLKSAYSIGS